MLITIDSWFLIVTLAYITKIGHKTTYWSCISFIALLGFHGRVCSAWSQENITYFNMVAPKTSQLLVCILAYVMHKEDRTGR